MEEQKINCPNCRGDNCFESTHNKITSYLCTTCGYTSNSEFKKDSDTLNQIRANSPKIVAELEYIDNERDISWFPSVINTIRGMVYPVGTKNEWKWNVALATKLSDEDQKAYPIPGSDDQYYESRLDVDNALEFKNNEFIEAMKALGAAIEDPEEQK